MARGSGHYSRPESFPITLQDRFDEIVHGTAMATHQMLVVDPDMGRLSFGHGLLWVRDLRWE